MSARSDALIAAGAKHALRATAILIFAFIVAPLVVIIVGSFSNRLYLTFPPTDFGLRWYRELGTQARWFDAAWNTVVIGVPVALFSVIFGTISALAVVRGRGRSLAFLSPLLLAPMMLPHIIIAIGLYPTIIDLGIVNTYTAVIVGHIVVATPIVFIIVTSSLKSYSESLDMAARTLGANEWKVFRRVTFPMIRSGMVVGGIFAFSISFDELMLSLFLTSPRTETLPRLIWEHLFYTITPKVAAVSTLILTASIVLLVGAMSLGRDALEN